MLKVATNNNGYFTRAKTKPPCVKDCADRTPDCHSKCSKYIEWKNGCEADKNTIEKHKQQEKVKWYKLNWFGVGLFTVLYWILCSGTGIIYLFIKLITVGRK